MFWAAKYCVYGFAFINTVLSAFKTAPAGALVATAKLRLSIDPAFNPTSASSRTELATNEANYSGYTAGGLAVTLTAPVDLSTTCNGVMFSALFEATSASPFVGNTVYGWWIDDGTNMIVAERFPTGVTAAFGTPGAFLQMNAILPLQLSQATS